MGPASNGGGISIPTGDAPMSNSARDEQGWSNSRSPPRDQGDHPPRRSSRSRSPARGGGDDRGRGDEGGQNPGNNLHVSSLSSRVDTRDLEQAFAKIGRVKKAQVMYDPHTRESRGFGFVTMETAEEADAAVTALNNADLMGKTMTVTKARRGRARTPTPGRYYGPPKHHGSRPDERPYDPRPYDSRYSRGGPRGYDDYGPPRARRAAYDDDYRGGRDYDRGYRDYDRGYDRAPDRRFDDRRY
ncbi:uncharacterized protein PHACADRAFT_266187 [Phanerochaete carnosa HHB-10118-sp]|uniref:RRM domain-containing protein n=1 Tax=Phanerochaete carnosa (strain HHB-10118-sp) TaxID=650164 RepID=K5VQ44_PHACS|nr:uncharacterized protein PHACADRAFT_266187 [Phanerochaete carnosa HHB-10118-sp]EKM48719.1 hypothetical protein PHACADRAFT_266187 [Phanerochaete carnosa HHB-10118-sp]